MVFFCSVHITADKALFPVLNLVALIFAAAEINMCVLSAMHIIPMLIPIYALYAGSILTCTACILSYLITAVQTQFAVITDVHFITKEALAAFFTYQTAILTVIFSVIALVDIFIAVSAFRTMITVIHCTVKAYSVSCAAVFA